jgi:hypothetical protein
MFGLFQVSQNYGTNILLYLREVVNFFAICHTKEIAYFSMEVGLDPAMSTYRGSLGIPVSETLRPVADLAIPIIGGPSRRLGFNSKKKRRIRDHAGTTI